MTSIGPLSCDIDQEEREKELEEELKREQQQPDQNFDLDPNLLVKQKHDELGKRVLLAAERGRLLELVQLTAKDASLVHYADADGYTPLHRASYGGHKDCAKYLLKKGANINVKTNDHWTPLHCAVRWNNVVVAEYLIREGADINAKSKGGNTPLHIVASNGRYSITCDIIQLLLYHPNCDYSAKNNSGDTAYDIAKRSGPFYKFWTGVTSTLEELDE